MTPSRTSSTGSTSASAAADHEVDGSGEDTSFESNARPKKRRRGASSVVGSGRRSTTARTVVFPLESANGPLNGEELMKVRMSAAWPVLSLISRQIALDTFIQVPFAGAHETIRRLRDQGFVRPHEEGHEYAQELVCAVTKYARARVCVIGERCLLNALGLTARPPQQALSLANLPPPAYQQRSARDHPLERWPAESGAWSCTGAA